MGEARELALRPLVAAGTPEEFARQQVDHLLDAEVRGHPSHGLLRMRIILGRIAAGLSDPASVGEVSWISPAFARVDGGLGLGPVVARHVLGALSERARETGVAIAAVSRTNHLGMLAGYVDAVARTGRCCVATCTTEALVHPWGGRHALVGTNPLAIGVPAHPRPVVLDMSTGQVSMGKLIDHARRGVPIPEGWAVDATGEPTTDAAAAVEGAIAPFGGGKGYALSLTLGVLVAALTRTALGRDVHGTLDTDQPVTKGDVFVVIDPGDGLATDAVSAYLDVVRHSAPHDRSRPVTVPGDRSRGLADVDDEHLIELGETTLRELLP